MTSTQAIAESALVLEQFLECSRDGFDVRQVPAADASDWRLVDGALQHASGGFFSVTGVCVKLGECILLYQPQAAITGVITTRNNNKRIFLLQARAEPGCINDAQYGPTVQSTPANYMRMHRGKPTPYVNAFVEFLPHSLLMNDTTQLDLGERYIFKTKRSILIETEASLPIEPSFIWATAAAIRDSVLRSAFFNIDLRSILSIAPWSAHEEEGELTPRSEFVRKSLSAPIRRDCLGDVISRLQSNDSAAEFMPLESLANWRQSKWGWNERNVKQGFDIYFYETRAKNREVGHWIQPLVNSRSEGHSVLACRERNGYLEMLVHAGQESGLATNSALLPSYVRYPGASGAYPSWLNAPRVRSWSSTIECDEGGRFFQDASVYEVMRVDDVDIPNNEVGIWIRLSELKLLLRTSNICAIQLRGLVSQLLGVE